MSKFVYVVPAQNIQIPAFSTIEDTFAEFVNYVNKYIALPTYMQDRIARINDYLEYLSMTGIAYNAPGLTKDIYDKAKEYADKLIEILTEFTINLEHLTMAVSYANQCDAAINNLMSMAELQYLLNETKDKECEHKLTEYVEDPNTYDYYHGEYDGANFCKICGKQLTEWR